MNEINWLRKLVGLTLVWWHRLVRLISLSSSFEIFSINLSSHLVLLRIGFWSKSRIIEVTVTDPKSWVENTSLNQSLPPRTCFVLHFLLIYMTDAVKPQLGRVNIISPYICCDLITRQLWSWTCGFKQTNTVDNNLF